MSAEVRGAINRILKEQMDDAVRIITANTDQVDSLVDELLSKNHLTGKEIEGAILRDGQRDTSKVTGE